jgi:hypothetical protein
VADVAVARVRLHESPASLVVDQDHVQRQAAKLGRGHERFRLLTGLLVARASVRASSSRFASAVCAPINHHCRGAFARPQGPCEQPV